jgi:prepilin-type N-terminal cleavage/methylation domain-containing protein
MPRAAGFTVIELMFVVALAAVLLTIGMPALTNMVISNRLSSVSADLMTDFTFARATAISRSQRVGICASNDQASCNGSSWSQGWVIYLDTNSNGNFDVATETLLRVHDPLPSGVTLTVAPTTLDVTYRPSGPADASRTFTVCKSGMVGRVISINATGRTQVTSTSSSCT